MFIELLFNIIDLIMFVSYTKEFLISAYVHGAIELFTGKSCVVCISITTQSYIVASLKIHRVQLTTAQSNQSLETNVCAENKTFSIILQQSNLKFLVVTISYSNAYITNKPHVQSCTYVYTNSVSLHSQRSASSYYYTGKYSATQWLLM